MENGTKIFLYGVSRDCPKSVIEKEFERYGKVSDIYITDKGYAFITMDDKNDAEDAIDALNGRQIDGQDVKVEMAHPKGSGKSREGYGRRDFGDRGGYGGDRYGDRNSDRDRGYRGGAARFDGGYSRFIHAFVISAG